MCRLRLMPVLAILERNPALDPCGERELIRRDVCPVIRALEQPAQFDLRRLLRAVERLGVALAADAPAQPEAIGAALIYPAVAVIALAAHINPPLPAMAIPRLTPSPFAVSSAHSCA